MALFFIGQRAHAQTHLVWDSNGNIIASSSEANRLQLSRDITAYNQARIAGAIKSAAVQGAEVVATRAATLEIPAAAGMGKAVKLGLEEFVRYPLASVGKGMVTAARLTPWGVVGTVAGSLLLDAGISYANGQWGKSPALPQYGSKAWFKPGTDQTGPYYDTPVLACEAFATAAGLPGVRSTDPSGGTDPVTGLYNQYTCSAKNAGGSWVSLGSIFSGSSHCVTGYVWNGSKCVSSSGDVPASDADIQNAIQTGLTNKPTMAADVLKNIYDNGGYVPLDAANAAGFNIPTNTVTGQPSTTTTTSTGTDGKTLTTTSTTTPTATVSQAGNTVTNNTLTYNISNVTTTVTKDSAGNTVNSSTSTTDKSDDAFSDSAMPGVPKLYEQKYPEGVAGVWNTSKPDISNTAFYNGIRSMFPSFGGGQCPVWRMSFNFGGAGNFGSGDLTVPCWIFQALGLVILATAAFTSRKILF
ncbi:hypothetical protein RN01_02220 [Cupriavidus sp. SHE]|nr:hypothetical protein RN01_02220 [Cupriavidus sp. SHE]